MYFIALLMFLVTVGRPSRKNEEIDRAVLVPVLIANNYVVVVFVTDLRSEVRTLLTTMAIAWSLVK